MRQLEDLNEYFSSEQLTRLGKIFNLKTEKEIQGTAAALFGVLMMAQLQITANKRIPNRHKAMKKLESIRAAARKLEILLQDFNLTTPITDASAEHLQDTQLAGLARMLYRQPLWAIDEVKVYDMLALLGNIQIRAGLLASDEDYFRAHYMLPRPNEMKRDEIANTIWPRLFKFWEMSGHKVANTPEGPTMRYLRFIHEIAEFEPPTASALRTAANRWNENPSRYQLERPPWEDDGNLEFDSQ